MYQFAILGHSICRRLAQSIHSRMDERLTSTFMLEDVLPVQIVGIGGWTTHAASIDNGQVVQRVIGQCCQPVDCVFIQLGGNDFSVGQPTPPSVTANRIIQMALRLRFQHGVKYVVIGRILPRFPSSRRRGLSTENAVRYTAWAEEVNTYLVQQCQVLERVLVWRLGKFRYFEERFGDRARQLFDADGVHLSRQGTYAFYRNIRGALMAVGHKLKS